MKNLKLGSCAMGLVALMVGVGLVTPVMAQPVYRGQRAPAYPARTAPSREAPQPVYRPEVQRPRYEPPRVAPVGRVLAPVEKEPAPIEGWGLTLGYVFDGAPLSASLGLRRWFSPRWGLGLDAAMSYARRDDTVGSGSSAELVQHVIVAANPRLSVDWSPKNLGAARLILGLGASMLVSKPGGLAPKLGLGIDLGPGVEIPIYQRITLRADERVVMNSYPEREKGLTVANQTGLSLGWWF